MTKSLIFQDNPPHAIPPGCGACDRNEVKLTLRKNGRLYRYILRDKVVVEDIYVVMLKAAAFSIQQGEPYAGTPPDRSIRDFILKQNVVI
jgi:hypothetical protein